MLDISEMAHVLGYPTCDTERFVTDPEFGTLLPNASYLVPKTNLTPPMEQYTNMYPFHVLPHYESLNSGTALCHGLMDLMFLNPPLREKNSANLVCVQHKYSMQRMM